MAVNSGVLVYIEIILAVIMGVYVWNLVKSQESNKIAVGRQSRKEMERLRQLRSVKLTEPLCEKTRPFSLDEIVGQEEGIRALRAALCGPNPQHVIIYGPPGVGKTAAARLVLEEAKKNPDSPFKDSAQFVEVDATIARFDERGIADPLIGSVHDPIYQGAGPLGVLGIPQPKPGAVTKAHGGVLFLDEIGELHPAQMNKLLKVLEDRKVFFESAYYRQDDSSIPEHIHDIFQNGLPADFRLVGATTRMPEEMPPALRSRCVEVFFRALSAEEIGVIARRACERAGFAIEAEAVELIKKYAWNGRDAVNIVQLAAGLAILERRGSIGFQDVEWVVSQCRHSPRTGARLSQSAAVGKALGLAVQGPGAATVIEVEVAVVSTACQRRGEIIVTGAVEEEEIGKPGHTVRRKSMVLSSVENVRTALTSWLDVNPHYCDIHINFPGSIPVDGPSAGLAIAVSMFSAFTGSPVDPATAFTGEISIRGEIRPVGAIEEKVRAALETGVERVFIPKENWQRRFGSMETQIIAAENIREVLEVVFPVSHRNNLQ